MKNIFKGLGLVLIALFLVVGVGAGQADATLTVAALTVTSNGALTLDGAASGAITIGSATTTGNIAIGGALTSGTLTLGNAAATGVTVISGSTLAGTNSVFANTTTGNVSFGSALTTGSLTIGGGNGDSTQTIGAGTGAKTGSLWAGSGANVLTIGGGAGTLAINTGDWDISTTGAMTGIGTIAANGALTLSGGTGVTNALATIGTLVTDAGVDVSANTGRLSGLQINLLSSGSTVTGFRGIDSRVTDSGTAANVVGLQALAKKTAGVSAMELWGTNSIAQLTGGAVLNAYGVVGDLTIGTGATITDVQLNSFATAGFFQSFIHTDAILAKAIDSAVTAVISSDTGRGKSAKGTFGVTSLLNGALSQSTEGASAAYKVMDFNTGANFDYGLDLFYSDSPYSNVFGTADVRLSNGTNIYSGTAVTRAAVQTAVGNDAPIGSIYVGNTAVATTKPNLYVKILDVDGGATNWERIVSQAAD